MDIQELLKSLGLSVARGVPQMASGFVDLAALPFTATGLLKPEQAVGSTDWMTARGYLPPKQEGLLSESTEMASSMLSPAGATKAGLLALGMAAAKGKGGKALNSILKTQYDEAMEVAQKNAALPVSEGGLGLPPDNTAMDRAKALGFDYGWGHGSPDPNITELKPSRTGAQGPGAYATNYLPETAMYSGDKPGATSYPLMVRRKEAIETGFNNPYDELKVSADDELLSELFSRNKSAFVTTQEKTPEWLLNAGAQDMPERLHFVSTKPSNFRSRFAAFDPKRVDENNLLASLLASLGIGGLLYTPDEEEQY